MAFKRQYDGEEIYVAINISNQMQTIHLQEGRAICLYSKQYYDLANIELNPYSFVILKKE